MRRSTRHLTSQTNSPVARTAICRVIRRLTQGHLLSLIHPRRAVPDHSFELWDETLTGGSVEIVSMRAEAVDSRLLVRVTLINRGAGHRIPTGKFGHREVRILAEAEGVDGQAVGQAEESLVARPPAPCCRASRPSSYSQYR